MAANDKRLALEELHKGTLRHRAGEVSLARSHYQRAVKLDPQNAEGWHLLGVAALQTGSLPLAVKHFRACIRLRPTHAEAHNNLGVVSRQMGRHDDALVAFRSALGARERYVEAAYNLALTLETLGDDTGAEHAYRSALSWRGNYVDAAGNLGNLLRRLGRSDEALSLLELAQRLAPERAQTHGNLALALIDVGRVGEAARSARAALSTEPGVAAWWRALGIAQRLQHDVENAIASLRQAMKLDGQDDTTKIELGLALQEAGAIEDARALYRQAHAPPGLGERLRWTAALSLPAIYRDDAHVDAERARFSDELHRIERDLRLDDVAQVRAACDAVCGVAPFHLHYQPRDNTELQCRFGDRVARVMASAAPELAEACNWRPRAHGGRIRVGIVSSHLMQHTVSRYFANLIASLDPGRFDVRVWYSGSVRDASTERIAARVSSFVQVNEDALVSARAIRASELDLLVYPEIGMDPRHQALAALRLAPVQCALYGHPATSGLPNVDFFLSSDALEPANGQQHYREQLVRLPGLGTLPQLPPAPGDGAWYDHLAGDTPLLPCLQNVIKLVPMFDAVVARICAQSSARVLMLMRNAPLAQRFRERIEGAFTAAGLDPAAHLLFAPAQNHADYLAGVACAPFVLDSPWFSGGATSLDAFSVGTPVLAWEGELARGRQTAGMLRLLGVEELIATDADEYVTKALLLLKDRDRRAALRARIDERKSALFENQAVVQGFTEFLERACG